MRETLIYSVMARLAGRPPLAEGELPAMAALWARTLRGPGSHEGRIVVLTNDNSLSIDGVDVLRVPFKAGSRGELFVERVRRHRHVPARQGDLVMQLDVDALAVRPIGEIFDRAERGRFVAATSRLSPLDSQHAEGLLPLSVERCRRWTGWAKRPGVSGCLTLARGEDFGGLMRRWAAVARRLGRGRVTPDLGDQAYLNAMYALDPSSVRRLPTNLVHHVRDPADALRYGAASVVHFPCPDKLAAMNRVATAL